MADSASDTASADELPLSGSDRDGSVGPGPSFRAQGKKFFLTYPRANFDLDDWWTFVTRAGVRRPDKGAICAETHEDGQPHRHALLEYKDRLDVRNARYWDYAGAHCNIQVCKNWDASLNYLQKEGLRVRSWGFDIGAASATSNRRRSRKRGRDDDAASAAEETPSSFNMPLDFDYFERAVELSDYRRFHVWAAHRGMSQGHIDAVWRHAIGPQPLVWPVGYEHPGTIQLDALRDLAPPSQRHKCVVLTGVTGVGKTTWVAMHVPKPALVIGHLDELKHFNPHVHKAVVFDDFDFEHLPRQTNLYLVDRYIKRPIHMRYTVASLPPDTERWFTNNEFPFKKLPEIFRRVHHVDVGRDFLNINPLIAEYPPLDDVS